MIKRGLKSSIEKSLKNFPAVGIIGSRQVGKTTLAKEIKKRHKARTIYLDLELPSDLNKLSEPELFLRDHNDELVIIDEIQRIPSLFPILRALIDQKRSNGRFLILGSASPALIRQASESLAGRIIYYELAPFHVEETGYSREPLKKLWMRGGYPDSFLAKNNDLSVQWRESFIQTFLERDIPQLGIRVPAIQLRRFWTMIAHSHSQLWNASKIANSLGVSAPTVRHYLDILEDTFIIRQLKPYHYNIKKRLVKSPKIYMRDSGLLHILLRANNFEQLQGHPSIGYSWEGFVIEQIIGLIPATWEYFFFRTNAGAEIDLLLLTDKNTSIAIEVKYSLKPGVRKGYLSAFNDLQCEKGFVVYPGDENYPLKENIAALPINQLSQIVS